MNFQGIVQFIGISEVEILVTAAVIGINCLLPCRQTSSRTEQPWEALATVAPPSLKYFLSNAEKGALLFPGCYRLSVNNNDAFNIGRL